MDAIGSTEIPNQEPCRLTHPRLLVLLFVLSAGLRLTAPNDFFEGDQNKQVGYVMDLLHHDHWATQFEVNGIIATKPPLYNWIAAGLCVLFSSTAPWVIKLPSLLAGGLLLVLLYRLTAYFFDQRAAFFACLTFIASHHFSKLIWFARTDMLMTAGVYLAIYVLIAVAHCWWKTPLLGVIMGASVLTKGPVGPCLFGIFLVLWAVRQGIRPRVVLIRPMLPGLVIFGVIVVTWLMMVMRIPDFHESVLHNELARRLPGATFKSKPFYYYFSHLFVRVAPWSAVAVLGAYYSFRKRDDWTRVRFLVGWATAYFLFFSVIPSKRHDLLLPVYPVVFMLTGYVLQKWGAPGFTKQTRWLITAGGLCLVGFGGYIVMTVGLSTAGIIALFAASGGVVTVIATRKESLAVLHAFAVASVLGHGVYFHWANIDSRVDYAEFTSFISEVKSHIGDNHVVVYHAHPLISYELNLHEEFPDLRDLLDRSPQWLIAPQAEVPIVESWTRWKLHPVSEIDFHGLRAIDATLYRVERISD